MRIECIIGVLIAILLLSSCVQQPAETPTPGPEPAPPTTSVPLSTQALKSSSELSLAPTQSPIPSPTPPTPASKPTQAPTPTPTKYPAPSVYYRMGNTHEVAVRPDGKELYITGAEAALLIVDLVSSDYTVLGEIQLPGRRAGALGETPHISFSRDSAYAYISRSIQREFDANYDYSVANFGDFNKIIEIDTAKRGISRQISLPSPLIPTTTVISTLDGKLLYFTAADFPGQRLVIGKLDLQSERVVNFLPLEGVNFITLSGDGKHIYATQGSGIGGARSAGNLFSVIDAESFKVLSSVAVGEGPRYAAVTPDERKAYISNLWSNDISIIDLRDMKLIATIDAGLAEPREIVITADGKKAYVVYPGTNVANMKYGPGNMVAVIDIEKILSYRFTPSRKASP